MKFIKKHRKLIICLSITTIFIFFIIFLINNKEKINSFNIGKTEKQEEIEINAEEQEICIGETGIKYFITVYAKSGIEKIIKPDGTEITPTSQKDKIAIDYFARAGENYTFRAISKDGTSIEKEVSAKIEWSDIYSETKDFIDINGKIAKIPKGFQVLTVEGKRSIDDGLIIQDEHKNQFVWIPIDNNKIDRIDWGDSYANYFKYYVDIEDDKYYDGYVKYSSMKSSVLNNKGFYISRYFANEENGVVSCSEDTNKFFSYRDLARKVIQEMYESDSAVQAHMPWGGELDAVYNFIDPRLSNTEDDKTRINPIKNIYRLNTGEWELSQEAMNENWDGDVYRVGKYREQFPANTSIYSKNSRIALYIK